MSNPTEPFPALDVQGELHPGQNKDVSTDPISSEIATNKNQAEIAKEENERAKRDALQTLKTTIIVSGVIVAVVGAIFAITKKLKEK
ncbi:hypothetical protein Leryth_000962 [Lithospermum erythrorhizon]|uniref:Uncharacterized protein n=1 Tax=Lithospermum erythrorhizon TaxID=34254 RepID=A0AAV3RSU9_LITER|nr:hypothetical protein Leryth_000962 [Lithospermum erythrorhizon]